MNDGNEEARDEAQRRWPNYTDAPEVLHQHAVFAAGAEWQASRNAGVSPDMVEKAAHAFAMAVHGNCADQQDADYYAKPMRAALQAALGGGDRE